MKLAVLHPGAMGISVALALQQAGHRVSWLSQDRSPATVARAAPLIACESLQQLCGDVEAIIAVCPPEQALTIAQSVAASDFKGWYLDANAIAPTTAAQIAALFAQRYIDGGIIGPPALAADTTRLYLSGPSAAAAARWFAGGPLTAIALNQAASGAELTAASMLKMTYAAYSKGLSALLLDVCALAEAGGVSQALQEEWALSQPQLLASAQRAAVATAPKAWRFAAEMQEIADTFAAAALPDQFHRGAAQVYARMAALKHAPAPDLEQVVAALNAAES